MGREIGEKTRAVPPPPWALRLALPVVPAAVMALAEPRRRPAAAAIAYGVTVFVAYTWFLSTLPAYRPLMPSGFETVTGLALTVAYGAAGGHAPRSLSDRRVGCPPRARV